MNEGEFEQAAEKTIAAIERALEASGVDVEIDSKDGGVLELRFADDSRMIINRHSAAREIWVAARSGGYHFRREGEDWRDTREGSELFAALSRLVSAQSGTGVVLSSRA